MMASISNIVVNCEQMRPNIKRKKEVVQGDSRGYNAQANNLIKHNLVYCFLISSCGSCWIFILLKNIAKRNLLAKDEL